MSEDLIRMYWISCLFSQVYDMTQNVPEYFQIKRKKLTCAQREEADSGLNSFLERRTCQRTDESRFHLLKEAGETQQLQEIGLLYLHIGQPSPTVYFQRSQVHSQRICHFKPSHSSLQKSDQVDSKGFIWKKKLISRFSFVSSNTYASISNWLKSH